MVSTAEPAKAAIGGSQAERAKKHIAMHEAIRRIDSLIYKIDALIDNIRGVPSPKEPDVDVKDVKETLPSLEQVLNHGPDNINEKIDIMLQKLDEIQGVLF